MLLWIRDLIREKPRRSMVFSDGWPASFHENDLAEMVNRGKTILSPEDPALLGNCQTQDTGKLFNPVE